MYGFSLSVGADVERPVNPRLRGSLGGFIHERNISANDLHGGHLGRSKAHPAVAIADHGEVAARGDNRGDTAGDLDQSWRVDIHESRAADLNPLAVVSVDCSGIKL